MKKQGIEQGINQRNEEIVIQMLKREMNKGLIKEITGVDEATIDKLHKKIQM